ncbi:MAG: M42 family peptidase, partial [Oscillospiraceae bacterium]|nr:M42 family peptidase [Oscillospiraceae bacterium]
MNKEFFYELLDTMSVSGHEIGLQKKVIAEMKPYCHEIRTDYTGNVICVLNPDAPYKVLLAGHADEIGMIVTHIQSDGLIRASRAGGIYAHVYPGHKVVIHGAKGPVYGAVNNFHGLVKDGLKA